jgi:hypothetical protein
VRIRPVVATLLAAAVVSGCTAARAGPAPEIRATAWLNTAPLGPNELRGRVVLVDFWTFG